MSRHSPRVFELRDPPAGGRLDQFLALHFPAVSLERVRRVVRGGGVTVNERPTKHAGWILRAGDTVRVAFQPDEPVAVLAAEMEPPPVLYEDADLLIVNKPAGLLTHPSPQERNGTLLDAVAQHILRRGRPPWERPFLAHRLDRDTSGVVALARHERAAGILTEAFQARRVQKIYLALVQGVVAAESGVIDAPIAATPKLWPRWRVAEEGAEARTHYRVEQRFARHTLLRLEPLTGRTHQLRLHCAFLGHPLVGEKVYRGAGRTENGPRLPVKRQLLHALQLVLPHPVTGATITAVAPWPPDLRAAVAALTEASE